MPPYRPPRDIIDAVNTQGPQIIGTSDAPDIVENVLHHAMKTPADLSRWLHVSRRTACRYTSGETSPSLSRIVTLLDKAGYQLHISKIDERSE